MIADDLRRVQVPEDEAIATLLLKALDGHGFATAGTLAATWRLRNRREQINRILAHAESRPRSPSTAPGTIRIPRGEARDFGTAPAIPSGALSANLAAAIETAFGENLRAGGWGTPQEVREMVNDTLGGRHLAIPYCTLCGSAQAYLTDQMPAGIERPVLRTSGLLIRSNKVMYDVNTFSVFDTFRGHAVTGPLAARGVALEQIGMAITTWGEWKAAHPDTTVL